MINLLPLNLYLKNKKTSFANFLNTITNSSPVVSMETDQKALLTSVVKFIENKI